MRAGLPHLDGTIPSEVLPVATPGVLAVGRRHASGDLVELYNVTGSEQTWPASWLGSFTLGAAARLVDALTGDEVRREDVPNGEPVIVLPAWTSRWLLAADDDRAGEGSAQQTAVLPPAAQAWRARRIPLVT